MIERLKIGDGAKGPGEEGVRKLTLGCPANHINSLGVLG